MARIEANTIAENPSLCDWSLNSMNRKTNIPLAMEIQSLQQRIDNAATSQNPLTATGSDLDDLVADRGLTRLGGTSATGQVLFVRGTDATVDIVIPAGTEVYAKDTDGNGAVYFTTDEEVTLLTGTKSIAADVTATATGTRGNVMAAFITEISAGLAGVDYVTNVLAMSGGEDEESDDDLRLRYIAVATDYGRATVPTMKERLEAIDDGSALITREAKVYNKGQGDIEVICDITVSETNVALIEEGLEACMAAGVSARGMLAAHLEAGANEGDLGDAAGGGLWVRACVNVPAEDTFDLEYVNDSGTTHTAAFVVPAGTVVGQCIQGTLEVEGEDVASVPDTQSVPYAGPYEYDALIGYGTPPLLFLVPEKVAIDVDITYTATDTPESDLADLIEASINAFLDDFAIGETLEFSDLYDAARIQYLGDGEWGEKFVGIDAITALSATDGVSTINALGGEITTESDGRIDPGTITVTEA